MKPFFSVIVPVYNLERYLDECVQSILNQDFKEFEILLIDDGSTDKSPLIINQMAKADARIRAIHKVNGGAASARNEGIRNASGKWVIFIDGDDYLGDKSLFSKIHSVANNKMADVIKYGCTQVRNSDRQIVKIYCPDMGRINMLETEEAKIRELAVSDNLSDSAWLHACRYAFIIENNLFFDESLKSAEDIDWVFRLFLAGPILCGIDGVPYTYRIRDNSMCTRNRETGFWQWRYKAIRKVLLLLEKSNLPESRLQPWYQYLAYEYYILLGQLVDEPDKMMRKKAFNNVQELKILQSFKGNKKVNLCRNIVKMVGIPMGSKIFNYYIHYRFKRKEVKVK